MDRGILLSIKDDDELLTMKRRFHTFDYGASNDFVYLNSDALAILANRQQIDWREFESARASLEMGDSVGYKTILDSLATQPKETLPDAPSVKVVKSYLEEPRKIVVGDFVDYFNSRFEALRKILYNREELKNTLPISRILAKSDKESVSLIGIVKQKDITKNNNIVLTIEDQTDQMKVIVNKSKPELYASSRDIVLDEVIGIIGNVGNKVVFANNILWPDVPITNETKKHGNEDYVLFLSDLHVGSNNFLKEDFMKFLDWINLNAGNAGQRDIASKVKYIFFVGDLIDGVGVYPGQETELAIKDAREQYSECAELLSKIPKHIRLIICAGNHDAMRLAEPQPVFSAKFSEPLLRLENATIVSNPSIVNIHSGKDFDGYNILLYHGHSFDYYIANVDSIREQGGYDRADLIMKYLLKRRHLAPTHTSTPYMPMSPDSLVIDKVPDFFVSGHIHKSAVSNYRGITLICASCWQSTTAFQEKVGHHPEPSRVPAVNLATRQVKILKFGK